MNFIYVFKKLKHIDVEYYYVLNDWFDNPKNKDVFEYIESIGCKYFIEDLPIVELNL